MAKTTPKIPAAATGESAANVEDNRQLMVKVEAPLSGRLRRLARANKMAMAAVFRLGLEAGLPVVEENLGKIHRGGKA